jgi:hypothetical protein
MTAGTRGILKRLRSICRAFPDSSEKLSHGEPAFFVGGRQFAMFDDHHHGAERVAVWCAAPPGAQEALVARDPERYFRPPYVGHRGWVGVRLDGDVDWDEVAGVLADAVEAVRTARAGRRA